MISGHLFIITAASGAGKTSLVNALIAGNAAIKKSISHTTRAPRPSEKDGMDYHFVSDAQFFDILNAGGFLESANVHGARYGTSHSGVDALLRSGAHVVLEIDWQGAAQVRQVFPESISIFILPPSLETLNQRLNSRGQDSAEVIARRVAAAREEMRHVVEFDYVIINDKFDEALQDLQAIVRTQGLTLRQQVNQHAALIQSLT